MVHNNTSAANFLSSTSYSTSTERRTEESEGYSDAIYATAYELFATKHL
jgi:hypothetical protein